MKQKYEMLFTWVPSKIDYFDLCFRCGSMYLPAYAVVVTCIIESCSSEIQVGEFVCCVRRKWIALTPICRSSSYYVQLLLMLLSGVLWFSKINSQYDDFGHKFALWKLLIDCITRSTSSVNIERSLVSTALLSTHTKFGQWQIFRIWNFAGISFHPIMTMFNSISSTRVHCNGEIEKSVGRGQSEKNRLGLFLLLQQPLKIDLYRILLNIQKLYLISATNQIKF